MYKQFLWYVGYDLAAVCIIKDVMVSQKQLLRNYWSIVILFFLNRVWRRVEEIGKERGRKEVIS